MTEISQQEIDNLISGLNDFDETGSFRMTKPVKTEAVFRLTERDRKDLSELIGFLTTKMPVLKDHLSQVRNLYMSMALFEDKVVEFVSSPYLRDGITNYLYSLKHTALRETMVIGKKKYLRLGEVVEVLTSILRIRQN